VGQKGDGRLLQACFPWISQPKLLQAAGRLLAEVTELARSCGVDFVILFADDDRLYARGGWARAANPCSWVRIHDHTTLGLATAEDAGALMVKRIGQQAWSIGEVDLLGHLF